MATTIKNFISTDSPLYEEHSTTIKIQILQNFLKYTTFKTYFCRPFFGQPRLFLTLGVTVPNTKIPTNFTQASYLAQNSKFHHNISWLHLWLL